MTQKIFDSLDLQPGDGRMHKGNVFGMVFLNADMLTEAADHDLLDAAMQHATTMATDNMIAAAKEKGLKVDLLTVRRYCAVAYSWVAGSGVDEEGNPQRELLPIRHSIHGRPAPLAAQAAEDADPHMIEVYWLAETA
jgi:hypothetical protein